jgi:TolB protein
MPEQKLEMKLNANNLSPITRRLLWVLFALLGIVIVSLILYANRPRGEDIVFISINDPRSEIHSINVDGSLESRLAYHRLPIYKTGLAYDLLNPFVSSVTNHPALEWFHSQPIWSPDGSQILFAFSRDSTTYLMDAEGHNLIPLTKGWRPSWSADGSKILFESNISGNSNLYSINNDGSEFTRITNRPINYSLPDWSPISDQIVFVAELDFRRSINIIGSDGSNLTELTPYSSYSMPSWSPDGSMIAYTLNQDGTKDIYLMSPDGSDTTRLTNGLEVNGQNSWSPDSSKIAFVTPNRGPTAQYTLYVIDKNGTNLIQLTDSMYIHGKPTWSPDSSQIAFSSTRRGNSNIYIINSDGTNLRQLTFGEEIDFAPSWRP